jgi:hypothetical protein
LNSVSSSTVRTRRTYNGLHKCAASAASRNLPTRNESAHR